jgi:hypothetical protein
MSTLRGWLPRFSLRWLLGGLAILSIGFAAATNANSGWSLGLAIAFHLILPLSIVFSIYLVGQRRAFWVGVGILNLWSHLAFGKGEYLVSAHQQREIVGLLNSYAATPLVKLQEDKVAALADQQVQAQVAAFEARGGSIGPGDISITQSHRLEGIENSFREAVTLSLLYFLMILGSFAFGWLARWTYERRHHEVMPAPAQVEGKTP